MTTQFDLDLDTCMDNALNAVSEIQVMAAKLHTGKSVDAWDIYEQACRIEFALDVLRECKK